MSSEDQARYQQRLQDAAVLTGRVAHAFDNVLTGILGFAELALSQTPSGSPLHEYVGEVLRAAQQGVTLTQELHLFSRCGNTGPGPTELAAVAGEEQAQLQGEVGSGVQVRLAIPADLPPLGIDAEALRQLLRHLFCNARESGANSITISARRTELTGPASAELLGNPKPGPGVEILVADSGSGLNPEARQRAFPEPFTTTKARHRGLGLAIVSRILFTHRGGFRLEPGPERGTVARVFLPVAAP